MAIVKCNEEIEEPASLPPLDEEVNDSSGEHYYGDHVKIGKKLIAVEHDFFTEDITTEPLPEYDIQAAFLIATRPTGIKDTIRAELGKFWVQETDRQGVKNGVSKRRTEVSRERIWQRCMCSSINEVAYL